MEVILRRSFKKQYKKLSPKIQTKFGKRLQLILSEEDKSILRVHTLSGNKYPLQSMNITGNYRALFIMLKNKITFYEIGSHSELYE
jgi:addiction module RelE/StbE family toxin